MKPIVGAILVFSLLAFTGTTVARGPGWGCLEGETPTPGGVFAPGGALQGIRLDRGLNTAQFAFDDGTGRSLGQIIEQERAGGF